MEALGKKLIEKNYSLSSAESFTVGGFAYQIGQIPGISQVYKGTIVSYQTEIKAKVLHVDQEIIDKYGVVSHECAKQMCEKAQALFQSDIAISFTGNAGPTTIDNKDVGEIYIGIAYGKQIQTYGYHLQGSRLEIIETAISIGEKLLLDKLDTILLK